MTYDEEIIKEATEIYEKNENGGALVGDLLRIIKSQKAHIEKFEKVEHFATKTIEKQTAEIERKTTECERLEIYMDELVKRKLKQVKSEAYREFAKKLLERLAIYEIAFLEVQDWSARNTIQQIVQEVKELTESK